MGKEQPTYRADRNSNLGQASRGAPATVKEQPYASGLDQRACTELLKVDPWSGPGAKQDDPEVVWCFRLKDDSTGRGRGLWDTDARVT